MVREYTLAAVPNADAIQTANVFIQQAGVPYRLPYMTVPDGMELLVKSVPGNGGFIYVAGNEPESVDSTKAWPLQPGEFIAFAVTNANVIYISGNNVGDIVVLCSEKNMEANKVVPNG